MRKVVKKVMALSLASSLAFLSLNISVSAEEQKEAFEYKAENNDVFKKISHIDGGSVADTTVDGLVDYVGNGALASDTAENQGDRGQSYSWAMESYGDYVYIGTTYALMSAALNNYDSLEGDGDSSIEGDKSGYSTAVIDALYNGSFFYQEEDGQVASGILAKINTKTGETKILMGHNVNEEGCIDAATSFRNAVKFNDKIYFCGSVRNFAEGEFMQLPVVYELDPKTDELTCVYKSMNMMQFYGAYLKHIATGIRGIAVYNDQLVISSVDQNGPLLAASKDGRSFTTIATAEDLFNYPAYHYEDSINGGSIFEMAEFNNKLYVSLVTGEAYEGDFENGQEDTKYIGDDLRSFAIVTGVPDENGTWNWTALVGDQEKDGAKYTFGIDPERTRSGACTLMPYKDHLYIGEYNDQMNAVIYIANDNNFAYMADNLEASVGLYRLDRNDDVELVAGDATSMFPNGGFTGIKSGFGDKTNQYVWRMQEFEGKLYISTFETTSQLKPLTELSNGDIADMDDEELNSQIAYLKVLIDLISSDWGKKDEDVEEKTEATEESKEETSVDEEVTEVEATEEAVEDATEKAVEETSDEKATEDNIEVVNLADTQALVEIVEEYDEDNELTEEQVEQIVDEMQSGDIASDEGDTGLTEEQQKELFDALNQILENLDKTDMVSKEKFIEGYDKVLEIIEGNEDIDENVKKQILEILGEENTKEQVYAVSVCLDYLKKATPGFDFFTVEENADGSVNLEMICRDGFGDAYNYGIRTFAVADTGLVCGTANPFYGTQAWLLPVVHEPAEAVIENEKEPTCTEAGSYDSVVYCKNCKKEISRETIEIKANGHVESTTCAKKASFCNNGQLVTKCTHCNEVLKKQTIASVSTVKLSSYSMDYTGKMLRPNVVVKDRNGKALKEKVDYDVYYSGNGVNPGIYTVRVVLRGNYEGTSIQSYVIVAPIVKKIVKIIFGWFR